MDIHCITCKYIRISDNKLQNSCMHYTCINTCPGKLMALEGATPVDAAGMEVWWFSGESQVLMRSFPCWRHRCYDIALPAKMFRVKP
jgi:hypothetical protein